MPELLKFCQSIGFLGAGNMAGAMIRGILAGGQFPADGVVACDLDGAKLRELHDELGIGVTGDPQDVLARNRVVVLAVKPQNLLALLDSMREDVRPEHLLISIAAGLTTGRMAEHLPEGTRLVRVMPNTPALVVSGAAGVAAGPHATRHDVETALMLMATVGMAIEVTEEQIDAVTALSGSGPAYVFRLMEWMREAGEEMGLDAAAAAQLTQQTFLGACLLAAEDSAPPEELRRRVTSPGGTTAAALEVMEQRGMGAIFKAAIHRARERSQELGRG